MDDWTALKRLSRAILLFHAMNGGRVIGPASLLVRRLLLWLISIVGSIVRDSIHKTLCARPLLSRVSFVRSISLLFAVIVLHSLID